MGFWRWNAHLSAEALKREVLLGVLARSQAEASGPNCSVFPEVRRLELEGQAVGRATAQRCPTTTAGLPVQR